jgi:hypothetical protein
VSLQNISAKENTADVPKRLLSDVFVMFREGVVVVDSCSPTREIAFAERFGAFYEEPWTIELKTLCQECQAGVFTTWVTFIPSFLWIFLGGPHIEQLRENKKITMALSAVTAAVVGGGVESCGLVRHPRRAASNRSRLVRHHARDRCAPAMIRWKLGVIPGRYCRRCARFALFARARIASQARHGGERYS